MMKYYTLLPRRLHRINCKLCLPPYILGSEGFWLARSLSNKVKILEHFSRKHVIKDPTQVNSQLELACRGCDVTYSYEEREEWLSHMDVNHTRSLVWFSATSASQSSGKHPRQLRGLAAKLVGKKCDYCDQSVVSTDRIRHVKEVHANQTFLCKICQDLDKNCFQSSDTMKEIMRHMVLKHGDEYTSYYDHIIYPKSLGWMRCTVKGCETDGKFLGYDRDLLKEHGFFFHNGIKENKFMAIHCRICEGEKEQFQDEEQLAEHLALKHKQIVLWKKKNGSF
jgi:hypothetical protein